MSNIQESIKQFGNRLAVLLKTFVIMISLYYISKKLSTVFILGL